MDGIDKPTGLQDALANAQLTRNVLQVAYEFAMCGIDLWQQICEKLQSSGEDEDFVLLDAGCGSGIMPWRNIYDG